MSSNTYWSYFQSGAREILGRPLSAEEAGRFEKYMELLIKWNRVHRLIGSSDPAWIVDKVFLDSLLFLRVLPRGLLSLADLGSGAGIPGVPLKIVSPQFELTLIEARQHRASFLATALRELSLAGVRVLPVRVEQAVDQCSAQFEAVVMRCAGRPGELLPLAIRLVIPGGVVVASGPPRPRPVALGDWVRVTGVGGSGSRIFLVHRREASAK